MAINITITVPFGTEIPRILQKTTPEENLDILDVGCRVFEQKRSLSCGLNNKDAQKQIQKEADSKIETITNQHQQMLNHVQADKDRAIKESTMRIQVLQKDLEKARTEASVATSNLATANQLLNKQVEEATHRLTHENEEMRKRMLAHEQKAKESESEKSKAILEAERQKIQAIEQLRKEFQTKAEESDARTKIIELEKSRAILDAERQKAQAIEQMRKELQTKHEEQVKAAQDRATLEINNERARIHEMSMEQTKRQACSSLKGADNERDFGILVKNTFGICSDFMYFKKEQNSSDHIFKFEGKKIMVENKKGWTMNSLRGENGLPKAIKDFLNSDCTALIFISEDTDVPDHIKPGDIDIDSLNGRPCIFIGNFSKIQNKADYITTLLIPILRILVKSHAITEDLNAENLNSKLETITLFSNQHVLKLKDVYNQICEVDRQQKTGIEMLKKVCKSAQNDFEYILKSVILGELTKQCEEENRTSLEDCLKMSRGELLKLCKERKDKGDPRYKTSSNMNKEELIALITNIGS